MRGAWKSALLLALAVLLTVGIAACGGGDSGGTSTDSSAATTAESTTPASPGGEGSGDDSAAGEGSASFRTPGGDNSIQNFGDEADSAEVEAAGAALGDFLAARAASDWAKQCTLLSQATVAPLEQLAARSSQFKSKGCATILKVVTGRVPASGRVNTLTNGLASLRVEDDHGFALYHGAGGIDYFVPMAKEDGQWKVSAIAPTEFPS